MKFFTVLGRKIGVSSGDDREGRFLFQLLSNALKRYNAILLHESFEGSSRQSEPLALPDFSF